MRTENRIVLVNPPFVYFPNIAVSKYNYCRPPLGLCYLASYVRHHRPGKDDIRIIDSLLRRRPGEGLLKSIAENDPSIVGFSVVTSTANESVRLAAELRKMLPRATLVAGGPHATVRPEDLVGAFDVVVMGEGEKTFLEMLERRGENAGLGEIAGVAYQTPAGTKINPKRALIRPLDDIPPPARELLELEKYYHTFPYNRGGGLFTTAFTARGCPNNCYFCGNRALWNSTLRRHSVQYVCDEIKLLSERMNMSLVFIDDDDFLADKDIALEICGAMSRMRNGMKWICHACVSSIEEDALKEMKHAGCVEIQIGVESGNENILKSLSKCSDKDLIIEKFKLLKKYRINTWGTFIIGHIEDNGESVMDTIRFAKKIDPTYASFIVLLPFPGTRAFEVLRKNGCLKTTDWDKYTWHGDPVFEYPELSREDLIAYRALAQRTFYMRFGKLIKLLAVTLLSGSFREMLRNFYAWLSVAAMSRAK